MVSDDFQIPAERLLHGKTYGLETLGRPKTLWIRFGSVLDPFWVRFGFVLGPFGIRLGGFGSFWVLFGIVLYPCWGRFANSNANANANANSYANYNLIRATGGFYR